MSSSSSRSWSGWWGSDGAGSWSGWRGAQTGRWLDRRPNRTEEELETERVRNRLREPNLIGYPQANNKQQLFYQDQIFKFRAPWKLTDQAFLRDFWTQMKQKYANVLKSN